MKESEVISVVIVDDEEEARHQLTEMVNGVSHTSCAGSYRGGIAALQAVRQTPPDLVFLDALMPDMNGWEFLRQARSWRIGTKIVVCTVCSDPQLVPFFAYEGADGYLTKPVCRDELNTAIRSVMRGGFPLSHLVRRRLVEADLAQMPPVFLSPFVRRILLQPCLGPETEAVRYLIARVGGFDKKRLAALSSLESTEFERQFENAVGRPPTPWLAHEKRHGRAAHADVLGPVFALSERERTVAGLLRKGCSRKEIARLLDLSVCTVSTYVTAILAKTRTDNVASAVYELFDSSR